MVELTPIIPAVQTQARVGALLTATTPPRVVLAHDWLVGYRGGEAVLDAIAGVHITRGDRIAILLTMFDDARPLTPRLDELPRTCSLIGRLPGATNMRRWLLPMYPAAVGGLSRLLARTHSRERVDLVVSTSSAAIKGLRAPEGVAHVCYCHTPARYLWSQSEQYAGGLRGIGLAIAGERLRRWDKRTSAHVTRYIANSSHTRAMIQRCYQREAEVVFPPVRTAFFTPDPGASRQGWLYAGALEPYKRVDVAIRAAVLHGRELTIAGDGSQRRKLAALAREIDPAGGRVKFEGRVSDDRLRELYRGAQVLLFPQIEDFGIVGVEAQACGTPVACVGAGGAMDTVVHGATGFHAQSQTPESLGEAAVACEGLANAHLACQSHAAGFSQEVFAARYAAVLASTCAQ